MTSTADFEYFQCFNFKTSFLKNENLFEKLEYCFSVETTTIESAIFPYKIALSKAIVKTKRMRTKNWAYHKERSFATNYSIF